MWNSSKCSSVQFCYDEYIFARRKTIKKLLFKKINLCWTGNEIDKVAPILSNHVSLNVPLDSPHRAVITEPTNTLPSSEELKEETESSLDESIQEKIVGNVHLQDSDSYKPLKYFVKDEQDYLISTSPDYKGKNKKNQQERFCLLYVWAYKLIYKNQYRVKNILTVQLEKIKYTIKISQNMLML